MTDNDAIKITEALHGMGESISPAEKSEVKQMLQSAESSLTDVEAEVAILFIEHLMPRLEPATVKVAVEAAQAASLKPADAQVG